MTNSTLALPRPAALWRHPALARRAPVLAIVAGLIVSVPRLLRSMKGYSPRRKI